MPKVLRIDNEVTLCGGYRHKHGFSWVVRLWLTAGAEVKLIPCYSPRRNADVGSLDSDGDLAFWTRERVQNRLSRIFENDLIGGSIDRPGYGIPVTMTMGR